ncbi:MAG: hypothetical protein QME44_04520 [Thermodesulfobacteriota bacterium]|nr:hypothetical protein [Thermodesulfobacteriota bacterium]
MHTPPPEVIQQFTAIAAVILFVGAVAAGKGFYLELKRREKNA